MYFTGTRLCSALQTYQTRLEERCLITQNLRIDAITRQLLKLKTNGVIKMAEYPCFVANVIDVIAGNLGNGNEPMGTREGRTKQRQHRHMETLFGKLVLLSSIYR